MIHSQSTLSTRKEDGTGRLSRLLTYVLPSWAPRVVWEDSKPRTHTGNLIFMPPVPGFIDSSLDSLITFPAIPFAAKEKNVDVLDIEAWMAIMLRSSITGYEACNVFSIDEAVPCYKGKAYQGRQSQQHVKVGFALLQHWRLFLKSPDTFRQLTGCPASTGIIKNLATITRLNSKISWEQLLQYFSRM